MFQPVEMHSKLVPIEMMDDQPTVSDNKLENQQKEGVVTSEKTAVEKIIAGDLPSRSHRGSIVSTVGPVTLDPRRISRISLSRRLAKQQQHRVISDFDIYYLYQLEKSAIFSNCISNSRNQQQLKLRHPPILPSPSVHPCKKISRDKPIRTIPIPRRASLICAS